jgi:tetratricopeptide (TPR) repeat protein
MVRITALRSLALTNDARAAPILTMHLSDPARLARINAAEGIFNRGITGFEGPEGSALARALDEWAESLRTFNDVASDHATLGWLEASRGRPDEARREVQTAIELDPLDARPHEYLGVLEARAGKFDAALRQFEHAKRLAPDNRNLDRLIEEARRRRSTRQTPR